MPLSYGLLILGIYLAAVLDTALAPAWAIGPATPDLLALAAVVWALAPGKPRTFLAATAVGLLADLSAAGRLGAGMASFAVVGYVLIGLRPRLATLPAWTKAAIVAPAVAAQVLGIGLLRRLLGEIDLGLLALAARSAAVGAYTAALALPLWMAIEWLPQPRQS
jgi:rod shape-determining protein MreD